MKIFLRNSNHLKDHTKILSFKCQKHFFDKNRFEFLFLNNQM